MKHRYITTSIIVLILLIASIGGGIWYQRYQLQKRQAAVHDTGAQVMSFSLDKTSHVFEQTANGGVEKVLAKDPNDAAQIRSIRMHLQEEARKFSKGDFSDPTATHGKNMPGLAAMEAGASGISFTYTDLPDGGEISYTTSDGNLIGTIHTWFKAQTSDHGHDSMSM